jgi:hypothetical protein
MLATACFLCRLMASIAWCRAEQDELANDGTSTTRSAREETRLYANHFSRREPGD